MSKPIPAQPPTPANESDVPEGWALAALGDGLVLDVQSGFACGTHNRQGQGIGHLRPMNVSVEGEIDLSNLKFVPASEADREERLVRAGDVVFNNTNSAELVGKTAYYQLADPLAFSNHMTRLRCRLDAVEPRFCAIQLHHRWREGYFEEVCNHHVSQASVGRKLLLETVFRLPPLPEQQRIVAKVEELLERANAARARLAKVPAILKRFRQSILAAACSGRLTEEWRERHPEADDGSQIVAVLSQAHEAAGGHKMGNAAAPTEEAHDLDPGTLPPTWGLTDLRTAVHPDRPITYGILKPGPHTEGGIPYVRVADFAKDRLNLSTIRRTTKEIEASYARARLRPGDVLLSIRGTVGRVCIVSAELNNANITQDTARLSIQDSLDRSYIAWFLRAKPTQDRMRKAMKGVAVHGINIGDVRAIQLPVPPLSEQREIVRRVEALFALAEQVEGRVRAATLQAERLPQAILARTFRGELVPTEAELAAKEGREYEPASVLLERIQKVRSQQKPANRGHGGKEMTKRSGRHAAKIRRPLAEVLREQGKPLSPERLFDLAGFDEQTVDEFYEQLRGLIKDGTIRERRRNEKDVTLEAVGA